ncbi:prolyl oligopeptidase family serine peptidase [Halosegnis sp.]|uniref:S9 family peptidase n=1 Tax=Halosegnis sp. TaxID=2864959 RepID=UPI0035D44174
MSASLPAEAFYDLTSVAEVAVSPTGDRVAYVAVESAPDDETRRRSVFVVPTDGSRDPHRLTRVADASGLVWGPNGDQLGVLMAREQDVELAVGRDEPAEDDAAEADDEPSDDDDDTAADATDDSDEPKSQVWVYDLALGGDARQVTDRDEGVADFDWGPDGDRIVVAARDPDEDEMAYLEQVRDDGPIEIERLQHKADGTGWLDEVQSYLFVYDVASRACERLDATGFPPNAGDGLQPAWGPGDRIAFRGYEPAPDEDPDDTTAQDLYTIAPDGTDRRRVTDGTLTVGGPTWSPDGQRIAVVTRDPENWYRPTAVRVADPAAGTHQVVTEGLDRTVAWSGAPRWLDDSSLAVLIGDEGRTRFARLDVTAPPARTFAVSGAFEDIQGFDIGGGQVACVCSRPAAGTDIHAFPIAELDATETDPRTRLTDLNPGLLEGYEQPACRRETVTVDGADNTDDAPVAVESIVYHPPDFDPDTDDPRPMILDIHGGPMAYDRPDWGFQELFWTTRGYVVWQVNYRGSTSYGRAFCEALRGAWNSLEVTDLLAATDAAVDRGYADPDRLFVTGFSQGGVNTAYLITTTDRFAAAAPEHGIYDARSCFGTDDSHNWWEADYGLPWENPDGYDSASSIDDVGQVDTPTLVTAGANDWRCPPSQAEQLYVSLRKQGVPARLVVYQDEHHNIGAPDRAIHRLETLAEWFQTHDPAREDPATADTDE